MPDVHCGKADTHIVQQQGKRRFRAVKTCQRIHNPFLLLADPVRSRRFPNPAVCVRSRRVQPQASACVMRHTCRPAFNSSFHDTVCSSPLFSWYTKPEDLQFQFPVIGEKCRKPRFHAGLRLVKTACLRRFVAPLLDTRGVQARGRGFAAPAIRPCRAGGFRAARRARQGGGYLSFYQSSANHVSFYFCKTILPYHYFTAASDFLIKKSPLYKQWTLSSRHLKFKSFKHYISFIQDVNRC